MPGNLGTILDRDRTYLPEIPNPRNHIFKTQDLILAANLTDLDEPTGIKFLKFPF